MEPILKSSDNSRMFANILMIILVAMNIFFSIQYANNIKLENAKADAEDKRIAQESQKTNERIQVGRFMKLLVDKVVATNGVIAFEDRIKLEADIRTFNDGNLLSQWNIFVASKDSSSAQESVVKLMSMLANKMI